MTAVVIMTLLFGLLPYITGSGTEEGGGASDNILGGFTEFWLVRLTLNILGYVTLFLPGYCIIQYLRKIKFNETAGSGFLSKFAILCVFGKESEKTSQEEGSQKLSDVVQTNIRTGLNLLFCVVGLQSSYLTWGVLQERIMTNAYGKTDTEPGEYFKNSQFLVFVNRILALAIALLVIMLRPQPRHTAPLYKYSYCSMSNIMSSWFQYEALKFVSFPTQVLAKASKVIPVMLMGKIVSKKTYEYYEYVTAVMISIGVSLFLLTSGESHGKSHNNITTVSGVILLVGYMLFDSFTSNWQGELFSKHKMSSIQMMAGVNMFSCLLTALSLIEQGGFFSASAFMFRHPDFIFHAVILSICSATGQLFIFHTISSFGPVTFVIIMTMRQAFAILLSCFIYSHPVTLMGIIGILIVFAALYLRIYANHKKRAMKQRQQVSTNISKV